MTRSGYDGVVYDLDGTLVRLAVDWAETREATREVYREAGHDQAGDLWEMLGRAESHGLREEVEAVIAEREREGARKSERLPVADELDGSVPAAVCSLNCEAACRIALDAHDLTEYVDAVVGRDTLSVYKPDPRPLLEALERIDCHPASGLFVGDSQRDETTADRAGVAFQYAYGDPSGH